MSSHIKRVVLFFGWVPLLTFAVLYLQGPVSAAPTDDFVTTWKTNNSGVSGSTSITIPTDVGSFNYNVDWNNDGTFDEFGLTSSVTHNFGTSGTYTIRISGDFPSINFSGSTDKQKLLRVDQWGSQAWQMFSFSGCEFLDVTATDVPNLSSVTNLGSAFRDTPNLVGTSAFESWDVSNVTDMNSLFNASVQFNQDISGWDVSNVTDMNFMLNGANAFNQPIGAWDVSSVTNMSYLLGNAVVFNQDVSTWDVSNVTNMSGLFSNNHVFNQDISGWVTSSVTDMSWMFGIAQSFNQDISGWDTSNVTNMSYMFYIATEFNQDISGWDVSNVTDMEYMLGFAQAFNQPIGAWDTSSVTDMHQMMKHTYGFDQSLAGWDVSNVTDMSNMFLNAGISTANYDDTLTSWALQPLESSVTFDAGSSRYCDGEDDRTSIMTMFGWTILDGGLGVCDPYAELGVVTSDGLSEALDTATDYTFTQTITNNGPTSVDEILFDTSGNECISITSADIQGDPTTPGTYDIGLANWSGQLDVGQTLEIVYHADITCEASNSIVLNQLIADVLLTDVSLTDTNLANNQYDDTTDIVVAAADLDVSTDDSKTYVVLDLPTTITQTIVNEGPQSITEMSFDQSGTNCLALGSITTSGTATNTGSVAGSTWTGLLETGQTLVLEYPATVIGCQRGDEARFSSVIQQALQGDTLIGDPDTSNNDYVDTSTITTNDVTINKILLNPEDLATGATLQYQLSMTNNGDLPIDLTALDGSSPNPFESQLFIDFMPPDLSFVAGSSTNPDVACAFLYDTTTVHGFLPIFTNHLDHAMIGCSYQGGDSLAPGSTINTVISATVAGDSSLDFTNHAYTNVSGDPDSLVISDPFNGFSICAGLDDMIDCYASQHINSYSHTLPVSDIDITVNLQNPTSASPGGNAIFDVTLTNSGPAPVDLTYMNNTYPTRFGGNGNLATLLFPANSLTYTTSDDDVLCYDVGPSSYLYLGTTAIDHANHQLLSCGYTGDSEILGVGQSRTFQITFSVNSGASGSQSMYAIQNYDTDIDNPALFGAFGAATQDIVDTVENQNLARYQWILGQQTSSPSSSANNGALGTTGTSIATLQKLLTAAVLISSIGAVFILLKRSTIR